MIFSPWLKDKYFHPLVEIGEYTYAGTIPTFSLCDEKYKIKIGKFCSFAGGVQITTGCNHDTKRVSTFPFFAYPKIFKGFTSNVVSKGDVNIGNDVWIGERVMILGGVDIGDGCVIGANSVITSCIEPYSIVSGNPSRFIRKRLSDEVIQMLLETKWWNWSIEKINRNKDFFEEYEIQIMSRL